MPSGGDGKTDPLAGGSKGSSALGSGGAGTTFVPTEGSLREAADGNGRLIGAAVAAGHLSDDAMYKALAGREFNVLTPENDMKWAATEPTQGTYTFGLGDLLVKFAQNNNMRVRGHTLVWYQALPAWVTTLSGDQLRQAMIDHVKAVASHFKGKVYAWDVVNEAVSDSSPTSLRDKDSVWSKLGPSYIDDAFRAAREADPEAKLFYNDYDGEAQGRPKSDTIYNLVKGLLERGVPIDGVGLQMHLDPRYLPPTDGIRQNIDRLVALGLEVNITEFDVPVGQIPGDLAAKFQRQAEIVHDVFKLCVAQPKCSAITFWGVTDKYTWLKDPQFMFRGMGPHYPLPFDESYNAKPAVAAIKAAFAGN